MKLFLILACASLSFGLESPLAAQEAPPPPPQAEQLPPPPPFPPMPSAKPSHRWVDTGGHTSRARSKASPARHHASSAKKARSSQATASHRATASHKSSKSRKAAASRRSVKAKPMHFSAKTIRSCHAMTYRQIIRNSSCRAMIKQELGAAPAPKHRASKKASARQKTASRSKRRRR